MNKETMWTVILKTSLHRLHHDRPFLNEHEVQMMSQL